MLVVSDTSPLRALQAIRQVILLEQVYGQVFVPPAVAAELSVDVLALGPFLVADFPYLIVRAPTDRASVVRLLSELDKGEAEAMALAIEVHADTVLVDEALGRRVAARLGLKTTGVLALLVRAKKMGLVGPIAPLLDELSQRIQFRVADQLRRRILNDAGESA
jgi:predicted nucleic acid-binding protein